jgi:hypothetical protein
MELQADIAGLREDMNRGFDALQTQLRCVKRLQAANLVGVLVIFLKVYLG